jgi:predicted RNase H-like HicB family nuclease
MITKFVLTDYIERAMSLAMYDKLEDGSFAGKIPACHGVIAFSPTLRECEEELRSTLEDWILLGLKLGHALPVIGDIDLNRDARFESMDTVQTT